MITQTETIICLDFTWTPVAGDSQMCYAFAPGYLDTMWAEDEHTAVSIFIRDSLLRPMRTERKKEEDKPPCATPDCNGRVAFKGICRSCYGQALRLIDQEKTTWEELEEMGMVRLEHKPFMAQFVKKKALNGSTN